MLGPSSACVKIWASGLSAARAIAQWLMLNSFAKKPEKRKCSAVCACHEGVEPVSIDYICKVYYVA